MATAQTDADNTAAPLDQLVVDVGAGLLRRWLSGRPGVEFIASLAGPARQGRPPDVDPAWRARPHHARPGTDVFES